MKEGVALLTGLPERFDNLTLTTDIKFRIEEANSIIMELNETYEIAKKEPHFRQHQWKVLGELAGGSCEEANRVRKYSSEEAELVPISLVRHLN